MGIRIASQKKKKRIASDLGVCDSSRIAHRGSIVRFGPLRHRMDGVMFPVLVFYAVVVAHLVGKCYMGCAKNGVFRDQGSENQRWPHLIITTIGTGKRGHYERGLFAGGISRISKFFRISRKLSDSPLFSTVWGSLESLESLNSRISRKWTFLEVAKRTK